MVPLGWTLSSASHKNTEKVHLKAVYDLPIHTLKLLHIPSFEIAWDYQSLKNLNTLVREGFACSKNKLFNAASFSTKTASKS